MPQPGLDRTVAEIRKSARENYRISLNEKRGHVACELRVAALNGRGVMAPTDRAMRIPVECLSDVVEALIDAKDAADRIARERAAQPAT